jgi:hypothetical protein
MVASLEIPRDETFLECPTSLYSWGMYLGTSCVVVFFTIRPVCVFNLLKTERNLPYIRSQSVPRCKHIPPRYKSHSVNDV